MHELTLTMVLSLACANGGEARGLPVQKSVQ